MEARVWATEYYREPVSARKDQLGPVRARESTREPERELKSKPVSQPGWAAEWAREICHKLLLLTRASPSGSLLLAFRFSLALSDSLWLRLLKYGIFDTRCKPKNGWKCAETWLHTFFRTDSCHPEPKSDENSSLSNNVCPILLTVIWIAINNIYFQLLVFKF